MAKLLPVTITLHTGSVFLFSPWGCHSNPEVLEQWQHISCGSSTSFGMFSLIFNGSSSFARDFQAKFRQFVVDQGAQ